MIRPRARPLQEAAGIAVLHGNLCPDGAVIKPAAASPELLSHRGLAVVFDSVEDLHARLDDPALEVDETSVLVLRGCGPKGYPGMPEVGNMPLPARLLERGVRDMVRISDGRMSGTAYGTVVLHVAPEAAAGGPLALVRTGDPIVLDVAARTLHLDVPPGDLARRTHPRPPPPPTPPRPAAGSASTSTTSSRPTAAPTSTSWSAAAATRSPASPTDARFDPPGRWAAVAGQATREEQAMAADDRSRNAARNKTRNTAQKVKGQFKEAAGAVTGNERLEAEGRADKTKASLKQAGEKLKDAFRGR